MHKLIKISVIVILLLTSVKLYSQVLTPEEIYEKVNDAVVVIIAYDFNNEPKNQGSGVVLNDMGYVVTNYHVFAGCERLEIKHYDKTITYTDIIGVDVEKDLLILKIEDNIFPSIQLANVDELKVGQRVYAIGSPLGFENSMSEGIISGLRNVDMLKRSFIQISAGISPGSSGGAVVNSKGELIGISTLSITEGQNLNFAIPINDILSLKIGSYSDKESIENNSLFYKGFNAIESGNYSVAIKYYDEFLKRNPSNAAAYYNRGLAYDYLQEYDEAISDYTKAISIDPDYANAYYKRGLAYYDLQKYDEAISDYTKAISIDPDYANAYTDRGNAYFGLQKCEEAITNYTKAISIDPNDAVAYYNRGTVYYYLQKYEEAISDYTKAISINPNYAHAYNNRGLAYADLEKYEEAINNYTKAIIIDPNDAYAYNNRGLAYADLKKYEEAISDYTKALSIDPNHASAYYNRGTVYYLKEDYYNAKNNWEKAIELNRSYEPVLRPFINKCK